MLTVGVVMFDHVPDHSSIFGRLESRLRHHFVKGPSKNASLVLCFGVSGPVHDIIEELRGEVSILHNVHQFLLRRTEGRESRKGSGDRSGKTLACRKATKGCCQLTTAGGRLLENPKLLLDECQSRLGVVGIVVAGGEGKEAVGSTIRLGIGSIAGAGLIGMVVVAVAKKRGRSRG